MPFDDFRDLVEPLILPINGKSYQIRPVPFTEGARLQGVLDGQEMENEEWFELMLGPDAFEQMKVDGVPRQAMHRASLTALADHQSGRDVAEIMWKTGGDPKALALMTESTSTDEESSTSKPGSSNGTKTSPRQSRAKRK